jgi:hypothetical protein
MIWLVAELQDVLAEIGFDRRDAVGFQEVVKRDFLGHHGLTLGDGFRPRRPADFQYGLAGVLRRRTPVHCSAGRFDLGGVGFQIKIQIGDRVILDRGRRIAQRLEFRQLVDCGLAFLGELRLGAGKCLLQPGIRHRPGCVLPEGRAGL